MRNLSLLAVLGMCWHWNASAAQPNMPVDPYESRLVDFEVYRVNETTEVRWVSVGKPFEFYVVERSIDKDIWIEAIKIKGSKSGARLVEFMDIDNKAPSTELYYRIKRFDSNGDAIYSNIIAVPSLNDLNNLKENRTIQTLAQSLEPGKELKLTFDGIEHKDMLLVLRNPAGDEFFAKVNYTGVENKYTVEDASSTLPEGNYIITATSKEDIHSSNMVIGGG